MSAIDAIIGAVLDNAVVAVPTLTTSKKPIPIQDIDPGELPHMQVRLIDRDETEELELRQQRFDLAATYLVVDKAKTADEMLDHLEAIEDRFRVVPDLLQQTLGVVWTRVTNFSVTDLEVNNKGYTTLEMEIVVEYLLW